MPKILTGSVLIFMAILSMLYVLSVQDGIGSSETIVVQGMVLPCAMVSSPVDACTWELKPSGPGIYTKKGVLVLEANTGWEVTVKDLDNVTGGHMTEWTGTTYASRKLNAPLSVSSSYTVTLPEGGIIQTGSAAEEQDIEVTLTQIVSQDDLPLEDGHVYRIALSFEGSPII